MNHSKRQREDYNKHREHVGRELGLEKKHYNALRRVSHELSSHGEHEANTGEDRTKHMGKSFAKAEALRKKLGGKKKMHFHHQTDPRGVSLYVGKERMNSSNYNSKGHPVY